jgi:3-deoxy-D-manno-octulosonic-acid transferase
VNSAEELGPVVLQLLRDPPQRERMGNAARIVFDSERGAVKRVMGMIDDLLQE